MVRVKQIAQDGATGGQVLTYSDVDSVWMPSESAPLPPASDSNSPVPRKVLDSRAGGLLTNGTGLIGTSSDGSNEWQYNFRSSSVSQDPRVVPQRDGKLWDRKL